MDSAVPAIQRADIEERKVTTRKKKKRNFCSLATEMMIREGRLDVRRGTTALKLDGRADEGASLWMIAPPCPTTAQG